MKMCVKVKTFFQIIILISILNIHCNEATKLFNITEDAISIGREILRVVENQVPGKTNLTEVTKTVCEIINKFNLRHNTPIKPKPDVTAVYFSKPYGCYEGGICYRQRPCNGIVWDCGTKINSPINICLEDENNATRYKYVSTHDITYGNDTNCKDPISARSWPRGFYKCTYCTCTCEELTGESDRYFNLRPVQSDIGSNYVITNARFRQVNHIVHIQIEQGKLLSNGYIEHNTIKWKKSELKLENKDEIISNNKAKYIKFEPNDLTIDAGQSTIPYFPIGNVIYGFRVPLSGAGLFAEDRKDVGRILNLKFLAYDILYNMKEI